MTRGIIIAVYQKQFAKFVLLLRTQIMDHLLVVTMRTETIHDLNTCVDL